MVAKEILKEKWDMFCLGVLGYTTEITQDRESGFIFIHLTNKYIYMYVYIYLFIYFSWRLITLQYCGGFCHTLT